MAHLGLLRVLEEEGIPVDFIVGMYLQLAVTATFQTNTLNLIVDFCFHAGCSVGAFVGGLYAKHASYLDILSRANRFTCKLSSTWLFLRDATLPYTSYFNGYSFGRALEQVSCTATPISRNPRASRNEVSVAVSQGLRGHEDRGLLAELCVRDRGPVRVGGASPSERDTVAVSCDS